MIKPIKKSERERILEGAELLKTTDLKVGTVAQQVQLNPSNFSYRFGQEMGCTPLEFRKRNHTAAPLVTTIKSKLQEGWTTTQIAQRLNQNRQKITYYFQTRTGQTPHEWQKHHQTSAPSH